MKKPKMKRVVAITFEDEGRGLIHFHANETIAECAREFGRVNSYGSSGWGLYVDPRYEFSEVFAWLGSFNL